MIRMMYATKQRGLASANWNKVVIIPVTTTDMTIQTGGYSASYPTGVYNDMSIRSTKLSGGNVPIKLTVIYTRFK